MKVLHVVSSIDPRSGGPVEALRGLTRAQQAEGVDAQVLATWSPGEDTGLAQRLQEAGVPVRLVGPCRRPLGWRWGLAATVARCVAEAHLVHIHALWEEVQHQAARSAWRQGKPYLFRPCGMLDPWSLRQGRWKKALYLRFRLRADLDRASALHFTTEAERDLTASLGLKAPALVEPNGIDAADLDNLPLPGAFRSRVGISPGRLLVLFLGRLHPKKGLDLLLPAFARFPGDALLVVAGPDSDGYRAQLESRARQLGIADRLLFPGLLLGQHKWAALVDADLFVLPSFQENFGVAVVEALAAGTPVLLSDQVNLCGEVRRAGVGGVVALEEEALAAELARWLTDATLRGAAADQAIPFVRERYLWGPIARRWVGHYSRLLNAQARPLFSK
jgi:glycosyltransferase involved in cell wall biosynthesis